MDILGTVRGLGREVSNAGFRFGRPMVLLQSDDWGRVGVRDEEGREELLAAGLNLGERPYDLYSLETAEDVGAVAEALESVRDSAGEPACLEMNFLTSNLDFQTSAARDFRVAVVKPLVEGLPGNWRRPALFEAYSQGIKKRVFTASLHGATHFCQQAVTESLAQDGERNELLRTLWRAETPYIHWRMPWVGYEYWNPNREPAKRLLTAKEQQRWIAFAAESFQSFFRDRAISACAPGYRANETTVRLWREQGIRVAQNGPGAIRAPRFDKFGVLHTYRSTDFEPALNPELRVDDCLAAAKNWFAAGVPFIISMHSINFHSTLAPFRQRTVPLLRHLLCGLAKSHPDLLFVNSRQLLEIMETGGYETTGGRIQVYVHATAKGAGA
jgi:hypothetical protein